MEQLLGIAGTIMVAIISLFVGYKIGLVKHKKEKIWETKFSFATDILDCCSRIGTVLLYMSVEADTVKSVSIDKVAEYQMETNILSNRLLALECLTDFDIQSIKDVVDKMYNKILKDLKSEVFGGKLLESYLAMLGGVQYVIMGYIQNDLKTGHASLNFVNDEKKWNKIYKKHIDKKKAQNEA